MNWFMQADVQLNVCNMLNLDSSDGKKMKLII